MNFRAIFDPMVRAHFKSKGGGADDLIVAMATKSKYELKSDAVTSVASSAFSGNAGLISVDFPNAITVGGGAFYGCNLSANVSLPKVATIEQEAFSLSGLKEANFPVATRIGESAFSACSSLTEVNLPKIGIFPSHAFSSCKSLTEVNSSRVTTIEDYAFAECVSLTTVSWPAVTYIGAHAFSGCGFEKLDFHVVTKIKEGAFAGCQNLTVVIVRTTSLVCEVDLSALNGTPAMSGQGHVYVPASMYEAYRETYEPATGAMFSAIFRKIEDYPEICG